MSEGTAGRVVEPNRGGLEIAQPVYQRRYSIGLAVEVCRTLNGHLGDP